MKNSRPKEGVICEAMHENKLPECLKTVGITYFFEKFCKNTRTIKMSKSTIILIVLLFYGFQGDLNMQKEIR